MLLSTLAALSLLSLAPQPEAKPAPDAVWNSRGCVDDERGAWFRDAKFGAIIHFGVYSHLGGFYEGKPYRPSEQIIGLGDRHAKIPPGEYRSKVARAFNPARFDAAKWVDLMKRAGQKYVILTTKHHDGFCMFNTATTSYNVLEATPFKRDVVKELADECRRQGLVFCVYYSIGDWCAKDVQKPGFASYRDYMEAQLRELLTNYGEIKLLWFDNWWYVDNQWKNDEAHARELYAFARSVNPGILVNDRCGEGVKSDHGDYATPENQLKGSLQSRYFEVVMTNTADDHWGWVRGAGNYRTPGEIIGNLIDSVSKGGNFVLNVGPTAEGEFPPEHVKLLAEIGKWTRTNGEAIYGTVPAPEIHTDAIAEAKVYATKSKNDKFGYLHVVQWPPEGPLKFWVDRKDLQRVSFLNDTVGFTHDVKEIDGRTMVTISPPTRPDPYATVFKLTFAPRRE